LPLAVPLSSLSCLSLLLLRATERHTLQAGRRPVSLMTPQCHYAQAASPARSSTKTHDLERIRDKKKSSCLRLLGKNSVTRLHQQLTSNFGIALEPFLPYWLPTRLKNHTYLTTGISPEMKFHISLPRSSRIGITPRGESSSKKSLGARHFLFF
jgi:hypothetical protein